MTKPTDLVQGTLDRLILRTLALQPMHGRGIAQRIGQFSNEVLQVHQGALYPALHRLEQQGWIRAKWGESENNRRAKFYSLTPDALLLAAAGLYGVLAYLVTQRTNELGVRIALGAQRAQILHLVLKDGLRPVLLGLVSGLAGSRAVAKLIRSLLYGIEPYDSTVFLAVVAILLAVAALACTLPAWRALGSIRCRPFAWSS